MICCAICRREVPPHGSHSAHAHSTAELNLTRSLVDDAAGTLTASAFLYVWSTTR